MCRTLSNIVEPWGWKKVDEEGVEHCRTLSNLVEPWCVDGGGWGNNVAEFFEPWE